MESVKVGLGDTKDLHGFEADWALEACRYSLRAIVHLNATLLAASELLVQFHALDLEPSVNGGEGVPNFRGHGVVVGGGVHAVMATFSEIVLSVMSQRLYPD
jgi:hypothetical protein